MHDAVWFHGAVGGPQALPQHLAAEHLRAADVAAHAANQLVLEPCQRQQPQQLGKTWMHQAVATPRRFCIAGLVVVYCRNCFFAGYRWCWIANAVSAASWNADRISFFLPG